MRDVYSILLHHQKGRETMEGASRITLMEQMSSSNLSDPVLQTPTTNEVLMNHSLLTTQLKIIPESII